ncbi:MAG: hypothetical protein KDK45_23830, partial [Leptospiraceae bacterium]|nr:hypothetical protein [Leptospiraceae bacterium]
SYKPFTNITFKGGYFFSQLIGQINEAPNPNDGTYLIGSESQKASYYQNLANTHIYGTSFELDWKPYRYLSFFTNYTYTGKRKREGLFEVDVDPLSGKINNIRTLNDGYEIDNIAARKANIGIYYILLGKVSMNLRMNWVGKRKAPSTNRYFQPYDYSFTKYPYVTEGKPDSYLASYTLVNLTLAYHNLFGIQGLISKLIIRNLFNKEYMGVGRQAGSATRPIDELQPMVSNPEGFVSPYHPQPRREVYLRLSYRL